MARAVLALGSNMDNPARQLETAIAAIGGHPEIRLLKQSSAIVTPPWGVTDQAEFHNAAVLVETDLEPIALLDQCLEIEDMMGRVRTRRWGPRKIDIDVIAYDAIEMTTDRLTLPHPWAHERDFVLGPVREIAPDIADWLINRKKKSG